MLPTLFYIPCEVAGWRVFGLGLLLALWAVACGGTLVWLVWRHGLHADTWGGTAGDVDRGRGHGLGLAGPVRRRAACPSAATA